MSEPWTGNESWEFAALPRPSMRDGDLLSIHYEPGDSSKKVQGIIASARTYDGVTEVTIIPDPFDA